MPARSSVDWPRAPSRNFEKLSFEFAAYCTRAESDIASESAGTAAESNATVTIVASRSSSPLSSTRSCIGHHAPDDWIDQRPYSMRMVTSPNELQRKLSG